PPEAPVFCPNCGCEYRPEFTECADCRVSLVSVPPGADRGGDEEPVTVYQTGDAALVALARSILDSADIPFAVRGEGVQDLIGGGRLLGLNPVVGLVSFDVNPEDSEEARTLLSELEELPAEGIDSHYASEPETEE
ncbi:MAG TPA: DUF2007 domain-containing protein, partial [Terriglobia bacterium]|nr:DUF2007 domain-containing protein [Terriglobia bacterium]